MKLSTAILTASLAAYTSARFLDPQAFLGNDAQDISSTDDLKVPGENPLNFCTAPDSWILTIENVDLSPNPPQAYVSAPRVLLYFDIHYPRVDGH